ncbi:MAG TPA: hypothetical protein ENN33_14015 [Ignavibacteria bacterium]|mgnify:CR=1 FL=1|nr:hypothetical protein [Ignavibacteria bacterium]
MNTQTIKETKKKIFSIVERLEPLELSSLEHFAEFLEQRKNDLRVLELLRKAKIEDEELSQSEIEALKISREQIKRGEFRDFNEYKEELGLK